MKISVIPFYKHFLGNKIFEPTGSWPNHWQQPGIHLYQECKNRNYQIATYDLLPVEQADVVVFNDYPEHLDELIKVKQDAPRARTLLMLYETPLDNPHWFNKQNHQYFDAILTYNPHLVDNQHYFKFCLPIGASPGEPIDVAFAARKPLVMINTNRYISLRAASRPWQYFERRESLLEAGWQCTLRELLFSRQGDLNGARRRLARSAESFPTDSVDLYGQGWEGRNTGWYYRFFPDSPYRCAKGPTKKDKLDLLSQYRFTIAYENFEGDVGYISEKIFDALYAGVVPIYRGNHDIEKYVSPDCFVDARKFKTEVEIIDFAIHCPEKQWQDMRRAGKDYIQSEQIKVFQSEAYSQTLLGSFENLYS
jgi:alpha(1,3/1,4) fucosyltransferase